MHRFWYVALLSLVGCASMHDARTPQQKNLNENALNTISSPVDDFLLDSDSEELIFEDEIDKEPIINENFYKSISISATENMKIREILTQMANLAGVNIFIVHDMDGSISFSAKNRPFLDILKDICSASGLKYIIDGNSVKIEIDTPMLKVYNVQFLNIQRDTKSTVSIATDIFSNQSIGSKNGGSSGVVQSGGSSSSNNGSSSLVSGVSKNDFWAELEASLKVIVGEDDGSYFAVHKQGGLITVYTTQIKHNEVQKYLRLLKDTTESQALIEAKILEVTLNDEFKNGINWNVIRNSGVKFTKDFTITGENLLSFGIDRASLSIVAGLIERFGAVKTLSSPRITVLNNQYAILKVAKNEVVYLPELQRQYATVSDNRSTDFLSTTINTIPIGLIISVHASVDKKNNTILLNLRPTISRINGYKEVPFFYQTATSSTQASSSASASASGQEVHHHKIPTVDVRELDSVIKLNSGQIVVLGGLMQESSSNERSGLPGLKEADIVVGSNERKTEVTELVIFLKATILRKKGKAHHEADKKMYDTFANDPRPLRFKK